MKKSSEDCKERWNEKLKPRRESEGKWGKGKEAGRERGRVEAKNV